MDGTHSSFFSKAATYAGNAFAYAVVGIKDAYVYTSLPVSKKINDYAATIFNGVGEFIYHSQDPTAPVPYNNGLSVVNGLCIFGETLLSLSYLQDIYKDSCIEIRNHEEKKTCEELLTCQPELVEVKTAAQAAAANQVKQYNVSTKPKKKNPNELKWKIYLTGQDIVLHKDRVKNNCKSFFASIGSGALAAAQLMGTMSLYENPEAAQSFGDGFARTIAAIPSFVIGNLLGVPLKEVNSSILNSLVVAPGLIGGGIWTLSKVNGTWVNFKANDKTVPPSKKGIQWSTVTGDLAKVATGVYLVAVGTGIWYDMATRWNPGETSGL